MGKYGTSQMSASVLRREALLDRVLVRSGKGREHQVADVGMARVNGQLIAGFGAARCLIDVGEIQLWINALRVQVKRQGHDVDVAGALAVAEQSALDALGAGHHRQFRCGHCRAAVVMRMHAEHAASRDS